MDEITLYQYNLAAELSQVANDFDNVPKVREMLFETQPAEMALYSDHFTIDVSGRFIFNRAIKHFSLLQNPNTAPAPSPMPSTPASTPASTSASTPASTSASTPAEASTISDEVVTETFIGAINTGDIIANCELEAYRSSHEELCKFCESSRYASLCDATAPYYYWINNNPVSSELYSDFENQCLEIENSNVVVKQSCELINSAIPAARLSRVYHLFKMIVDSMTLMQLGSVFNDSGIDEQIDAVRNYSYVLVDKQPARINLGSTSYTIGLEEPGMPFAKMLIILALKLKEEQKPLPFLNVNGSSVIPGSQR